MDRSVLVFISHASEDKEAYIDPIVRDLEDCFISVWIDTRKIAPGDNLRKSIFRDGIDKADVALLFFTAESLKSSWVDREIKHVLREEAKRGNDFDLRKIISIFDSQATYDEIAKRYPELTDDLLHLMPRDYTKKQLGQLISAIWAKYLSLQGGDIATQKQLLQKDKELFQKDKDIQKFQEQIKGLKESKQGTPTDEFDEYLSSGRLKGFIDSMKEVLVSPYFELETIPNGVEARAFGLVEPFKTNLRLFVISEKGKSFFAWLMINKKV